MGETYAVFGDSIAAGMGVRGRTFGMIVASHLDAELMDFSSVARPASESLKLLLASDACPDFAVIAHGVTEALPRPSARSLRYIPPRWRRVGWTDPRPYFSSNRAKALGQRLESGIRWRVKTILMRLSEPERLVELPDYVQAMTELVSELQRRGSTVVILAPTALDSRFFPGAEEAEQEYLDAIRHLGMAVITPDNLHRWSDFCADHFHPNASGHQRIAQAILDHAVR